MLTDFNDAERHLIDYWLKLPRDVHPVIPAKTAVQFPRLAKIAPAIGIAEYCGPTELLVRIVGSDVDQSVGGVSQRQNAFDLTAPGDHADYNIFWRTMIRHPVGMQFDFVLNLAGGDAGRTRALHLPLADTEGTPRYVVSVFSVINYYVDKASMPAPTDKIYLDNFHRLRFIDVGSGFPSEGYGRFNEKDWLHPVILGKDMSA